ncbi:MAG TPA: hypothetical protein VFW09_03070 [Solirubrobacteraceae bacterium]|nr:hypothetical protein [Solirubrobacteraceae bacterium]
MEKRSKSHTRHTLLAAGGAGPAAAALAACGGSSSSGGSTGSGGIGGSGSGGSAGSSGSGTTASQKNIDRKYLTTPVNSKGNYFVPTDYGKYGIAVRTDLVPETITSWKDLFALSHKYSSEPEEIEVCAGEAVSVRITDGHGWLIDAVPAAGAAVADAAEPATAERGA